MGAISRQQTCLDFISKLQQLRKDWTDLNEYLALGRWLEKGEKKKPDEKP